MEIQKYDMMTSFGLTGRYSQNANKARKMLSQTNSELINAIDSGKDKFANITQSKGQKGDFCITHIISNSKEKDNFVVRFFIKDKNKTFSDQIKINAEADSMPRRHHGKQQQPQKSAHNLQENIATYFMESYSKNKY